MPWGVADYDVKLRAAAAVDVVVASGTHHAVAVGEPGSSGLGVAGGIEPVGETDFRGVAVWVRQAREWQIRAQGRREFGRQRFLRVANGPVGIRVGPLHDVVVLGPDDRESVEVGG